MLSDANYDVKQNETKGTGLKILAPKQMLQRLPIALTQVKAGYHLYEMVLCFCKNHCFYFFVIKFYFLSVHSYTL